MRYPKPHLGTVLLLSVAIAVIACEPAAEQPQPPEKATAEADLEALNKLREELFRSLRTGLSNGARIG